MTSYRAQGLCRTLNLSYFDVMELDALLEATHFNTPDREYYRHLQHKREFRALLNVLMSSLSFKDENAEKKYRESVFDSIEPPKFVNHWTNPYSLEVDEDKRAEFERKALEERENA